MTKLLTQAFEKASELPEDLQDQLAHQVLEEIEWEARWDSTLEGSQEKLEKLRMPCGKTVPGRQRKWDSTICEIPARRRLHFLFSGAPSPHPTPFPQEL